MNWYCIRSATRREKTARDNLIDQRFAAHLPQEKRWRRIRAVKSTTEGPLWPGYLFVQCERSQFYDILQTDGVHQFVRYVCDNGDLEPMPFPAEMIGDLISQEHFGLFDATRGPSAKFKPRAGDRARVVGGKWLGYMAQVISTSAKKRQALIYLEGADGRQVKMTLDVAHLDAA